MAARKITIDVVSDVVCPWCFLGRKRLEAALAMVPDVEAEVRWRPFQLDPTLPPQGKDRQAYMREKFGTGGKIDDIHKQLTELGEEKRHHLRFRRHRPRAEYARRTSRHPLGGTGCTRYAGSDGRPVVFALFRAGTGYWRP